MVAVLRFGWVFLVPWIVLSQPDSAFFGFQLAVLLVLVILGIAGMMMRNASLPAGVSASLLALIVWGKIARDIFALSGEDTALLLLQFMIVIFFMEASNAVLKFDSVWSRLRGKKDDTSAEARVRLMRWATGQLMGLSRLIAGAFVLSLGLLVLGGIINVSVSQLALNAVLVLSSVVAILILLTYKREPEARRIARS